MIAVEEAIVVAAVLAGGSIVPMLFIFPFYDSFRLQVAAAPLCI